MYNFVRNNVLQGIIDFGEDFARKIKDDLKKSIVAGILIGIGGISYLTIGGPIGAIAFSIGLLAVLTLSSWLYTGKIAYVKTTTEFLYYAVLFLGNVFGAWLCSCIFKLSLIDKTSIIEIWNNKLSESPTETFFLSFLCGTLMYIAVEAWKKHDTCITALCVFVFVVCGMEHSVADAFYMFSANSFNPMFIANAFVGNTIGAIALRKLSK